MEFEVPLFRILLLCLLYLYLLLFHFHLSFSSSFNSSSSPPVCLPHQSSALFHFKNSFDLSWRNCDYLKTWENGTDCCSWVGVTCDSMSGHVIGLDLSLCRLQGEIHPNSTLFRLTHLQTLNLAYNYFDGSQLPSQIGGLVSLTHLNLSDSLFVGDIPSQISHLSKLVSLDLSENIALEWKGTTWKRLLQNATALRVIVVYQTNMSSISLSHLSSKSSLVTLNLADTGIGGHLTSDILCLPNLQELYLQGNRDIQVIHLQDQLNCSTPTLSVLDLSGCSFQRSVIPSFFGNLTHLTSLTLSGNEFISSSIPSSLSNLQQLTHLDLSSNELASFPSSLSNLQNLLFLDLSGNNFNGSIPSSLSHLSNLTHLDLSFNKLSSIPSSLSYLSNLIHLDLSYNQLSGPIPDVFYGLTKLQTILLHENNLKGLPSSLFALTELSLLDCSRNELEGPLPSNITGFSNLTELILSDNKLNETIPSWCLSLPSLTYIDLANNWFTGNISAISSSSLEALDFCGNKLQGNIPESIFSLANLTYLCLSSDNSRSPVHFPLFSKFQKLKSLSLSGYSSLSLNSDINVSYSFPNLKFLDLSNNKFQGKVPKWITDIDSLSSLKLSDNLFTSIDHLPWNQLQFLDLSSNFITSDISSFICSNTNATFFSTINLSHNKFTGTFPHCLANFPYPEILDLQMNKLHGTLADTFSVNTELRTLNLNGNQFEGPLPKSLSNCTYLQDLNLGNNQIEDVFPHWLQNLRYLKILNLRANKLYGPVVSMVKKHDPFPVLTVFDISCNNFSGPLPQDFIKNFRAMTNSLQTDLAYMEMQYGTLNGYTDFMEEYDNSLVATIKGVNTPYVKIPSGFANIDLSENKFEGEIPNVIGKLQGVIGLNLSHNRLTGHIPRSIGNLTNLESLDLSSNMLTGGIPIELTDLNSLEVLNLSQNHLVGPIPKGKQFDTFSNESYEGNIGLCGFPLSIQCNSGPESRSSGGASASEREEKLGFGWKPVAIGYGCGMVFGMGLGWLVLFIGKPLWLVAMFGAVPKKWIRTRRSRTRTRTRTNRGNPARMN